MFFLYTMFFFVFFYLNGRAKKVKMNPVYGLCTRRCLFIDIANYNNYCCTITAATIIAAIYTIKKFCALVGGRSCC